jgi:hypothetical protein
MIAPTNDQQFLVVVGFFVALLLVPVAMYLIPRLRAESRIPPDRRPPHEGPMLAAGAAIEQTRQILGPPRAGRMNKVFVRRPPAWMHQHRADPLWGVYQIQQTLLDHGQVVWGCIVQANALLFEPGEGDSPAAVIYSDDPYLDAEPEELGYIAHQLFELKGRTEVDADVRQFAASITDERTRDAKLIVPPRLTGGRRVYYTAIMVIRAHLPDGVLRDAMLPLLVLPDRTPWTLVLPSHFWSPSLVLQWKSAAVGL